MGIQSETDSVLKKRISVSKKRQVTDTGEFDEEILADLISEGFSGKELLLKFKEARRKVRPAIKELLREAGLAAQGKAPFATYEDVFGAGKDR